MKTSSDTQICQQLITIALSADNQSSASETHNERIIDLYNKITDSDLWRFANRNRTESTVAHALFECFSKEKLPGYWYEAHQKCFNLISSYMVELDRAAELLESQGIPMVALKNAGIARGIYSCVGCCPMGDLDVLVRPGDFRKAHKILTENGFTMDIRCPLDVAEIEYAEQSGGAEYTRTLTNGETLWFELQWRPVAGRWIRPDQEPTADELMERSIAIPGSKVRLLAPDDNLLQVALHTAKHTYVRAPGFRLHTDVDRIVKLQKIDWEVFTQRAKQLQVKTAVYFSLAIPKELFDTPIPDEVIKALSPPAWKKWVINKWFEKIGLFDPDERKFGKIGYIVFNCLLYDTFLDLAKGVIPSSQWMKKYYDFDSDFLLLYYYSKRILDLAFKRVM